MRQHMVRTFVQVPWQVILEKQGHISTLTHNIHTISVLSREFCPANQLSRSGRPLIAKANTKLWSAPTFFRICFSWTVHVLKTACLCAGQSAVYFSWRKLTSHRSTWTSPSAIQSPSRASIAMRPLHVGFDQLYCLLYHAISLNRLQGQPNRGQHSPNTHQKLFPIRNIRETYPLPVPDPELSSTVSLSSSRCWEFSIISSSPDRGSIMVPLDVLVVGVPWCIWLLGIEKWSVASSAPCPAWVRGSHWWWFFRVRRLRMFGMRGLVFLLCYAKQGDVQRRMPLRALLLVRAKHQEKGTINTYLRWLPL